LEEYFAGLEKSKAPAILREDEPAIAELEGMIASFETKHSLADLHAIVDLSWNLVEVFKRIDYLADPRRIENDIATYKKHNPEYIPTYKANIAKAIAIIPRLNPKDARKFEIRMAAKKDLILIMTKLNSLGENENYRRLKAKCLPLQKAFGSLQGDKINHS
jgi:hypothetical protein